MPYKDGWSHLASFIEKGKDGKGYKGSYQYNDITFSFSFREDNSPSSPYKLRGKVSLISPKDGYIMQVGPKKRKEISTRRKEQAENVSGAAPVFEPEKRYEALNASRAAYLTVDNAEAVKQAVAEKAALLYGDNVAQIDKIQHSAAKYRNVSFAQAVQIYGTRFFTAHYGAVMQRTRREYEQILRIIGGYLGTIAIDQLRIEDIKRLARELRKKSGKSPEHRNDKSNKKEAEKADSTVRRQLTLAGTFWVYYSAIKGCKGDNPFTIFLKSYFSNKINPKKLQRDAVTVQVLPTDIEAKLNKMIAEKTEDGRYVAVVLVKDAGLSAKEACSIRWVDVIFDNDIYDYSRISLRRDDIAGATHDFTRPIFPFAGEVLHRRYDLLCKEYGNEAVAEMSVASLGKNPEKSLNSKTLASFCKVLLTNSGFWGFTGLTREESERHGAGVSVLLKNYAHKLNHYCGLSADKSAVRFLRGQSVAKDVTADNYRSFTSPEGQWYLYSALRRDGRFQGKSGDITTKIVKLPDGTYRVAAQGPDRLTGAKVTVSLKAGETISCIARHGIEGTVQTRASDESGKLRRYVKPRQEGC